MPKDSKGNSKIRMTKLILIKVEVDILCASLLSDFFVLTTKISIKLGIYTNLGHATWFTSIF